MSTLDSAIYRVRIAHRRLRPKRHDLKYGAFYVLLDLDELDDLQRRLKFFSVNRFNIFSFCDRDHGPGEDAPLRPWIETNLRRAGVESDVDSIHVLCLPRIFGYAFNPLTVYFCYSRDESLAAILYEVSNTFGERHTYMFRVDESGRGLYQHDCEKRFYVSPFMNVEGRYHFRVKVPGDKLYLHIHQTDTAGPILDAWVRGKHHPFSDRNLLSSLARNPLLMLKVLAGIHWEAVKLWAKGIAVTERPPAPADAVTFVDTQTN